ncbi:MAG: DNA cytosine methyltransferase [Patescibacteria group bacterium]
MEKTFVSLFSGAGGLDQGFIQAGWQPILLSDFWEPSIKTLKENHPNCIVEQWDVKEITEDMIKKAIGNTKITVVTGGPPCQAFSRLNQNQMFNDDGQTEENLNDPRRSLFMDFLRIASYICPDIIVMENVADLKVRKLGGQTRDKDEMIVNIIEKEFNKIEYIVKNSILRAQDYGVPQMRKRMIFIAIRNDLNISPSLPDKIKLETSVKKELVKILSEHPNQDIKKHTKIWKDKINLIPQGGYYNDLPVNLKVLKKVEFDFIKNYNGQFKEYCFIENEQYKVFKVNTKTNPKSIVFESGEQFNIEYIKNIKELFKIMPRMGTYLRRINSNISHTITRNPLIHPTKNRELTVREKASIQTFPPNYKFVGSIQEQHILVGNSVPCNLGENIAIHLERLFTNV